MPHHFARQNYPSVATSDSSSRTAPPRLRLEALEKRISPTSWIFAIGMPMLASPDADMADGPDSHASGGDPLPELGGPPGEGPPDEPQGAKAEETAQAPHRRLRQASDSLEGHLSVDSRV